MKSLLTKTLRLSLPFILSGLVPISGRGQSSKAQDLTQISLEDLINIQVTSVSKKEQKLVRAGAAVYVSFLNLTRRLEWDSSVSYVGRLTDQGSGPMPGYTRVHTRLGWRAGESVELSITGQNPLTPRHAESPDFYPVHHTLVDRSVVGKVIWRF